MAKKIIFPLLYISFASSVHGMSFKSIAQQTLATQAAKRVQLMRQFSNAPQGNYKAPFEQERKNFCAMLTTKKPWALVAQKNITELAHKERELMSVLLKINGASVSDFDRLKSINQRNFRCMEQKGVLESNALYTNLIWKAGVDRVRTLLENYGIHPLAVGMQQIDKATHLKVCVGQTVFAINEKFIKEHLHDRNMFNAFVHHEIQHLLHNDCYTKVLLRSMLTYTVKDPKRSESYIAEFARFQEERADKLAALNSPRTALALVQFFSSQKDNPHDMHHPLISKRAEYVHKLYHEMLATIKK
ncbi:MAG: hypothetical protein NTX86_06420 [Candidatus Dependentiae bacterium]|nr:hypothetical protein [Candidatus Dependentiae bacterium]